MQQNWDNKPANEPSPHESLQQAIRILAVRATKDEDSLTRKHAIYLLGLVRDPDCIETFIRALRDPEKAVRVQATRSLADMGEPASERLISLLHDTDWKVRYRAAEALGMMKETKAVEPLIQLLNDEKDHMRYIAVKSLGSIGDPVALRPLKGCMDDENDYVRTIVSSVFSRLFD